MVGVLALAALGALPLMAGCVGPQTVCTDPCGQPVVAQPAVSEPPINYRAEPPPPSSSDPVNVTLVPRQVIAPVGCEIALVAGVVGPDQYYWTNERVEWTIEPGSVGHIVEAQRQSCFNVLLGDFNWPRKLSETRAVGSTSRQDVQLTRGTCTPCDDLFIRRGQTWITVSSAAEGSSYVTAYAPGIAAQDCHKKSAVIHWVDAQFAFPPPAVVPTGSRHTLTTVVTRRSDQCPLRGWTVRYSVGGGPPAGFAPSGAATVEVVTDDAGRASAEIFQTQPAQGANPVSIQVVRPARGGAGPLAVQTGATTCTWSAPGLNVRQTGPAVASINALLTYRIEVTNGGGQAAEDLVVTQEIPEGASLASSNPPGTLSGRTLQWRIGRLPPATCRSLEVNLRAERQGTLSVCAEAVAAGGLRGRHCVTTDVSLSPPPVQGGPAGPSPAPGGLEMTVTGPERVEVGGKVTFEVRVTNRNNAAAQGLVLLDRFDRGLDYELGPSPIRNRFPDLAPGQSQSINVSFRAVQAGRLCHTVELSQGNIVRATKTACVTATEAGAPAPPAGPDDLTVEVTPPVSAEVGQPARVSILVKNNSQRTIKAITVVNQFDPALDAAASLPVASRDENNALVWTIPELAPGGLKTIQVEYNCRDEKLNASCKVVAKAADGTEGTGTARLDILAPAGLTMDVAPRGPATAGRPFTVLIHVTNTARTPDSNLQLTVRLPAGTSASPLDSHGPGDSRATVEGGTVRFEPVPQIGGSEKLTWRLRLRSDMPGPLRIDAQLTSVKLRSPLVKSAETTINPGLP